MTAANPAPHRFAGRVPAGVEPVVPGPGQESVWDYPRPPRMETVGERIRVIVGGETIADSDRALRVVETAGAPVYYVPREDVRMDLLSPTLRSTHCEWKGDASYWTITVDGRSVENAAWSYENPPPGFGQLAGRIAFHPDHVDFKRVGLTPAETRALSVDEVVRHTDSGSGASQAEHWTSNVSMPDDAAWEGDDIREDQGGETLDRPYQGTGSI